MSLDSQICFDYIVLGCGGIGSAAVYWLSKRAHSGVLGLEQFQLGHDNGGSQDHSRGIRMAYHDDRYTKLIPDAYEAWRKIENESGIQVMYKTGGVDVAHKNMEYLVNKYAESLEKEHIPYENLTGLELHQKFPQFDTDDSYVAVYQKDAGLVDAAQANAIHIQLARGNGATVIENCGVTRLSKDKQGIISVHTTKVVYFCRKLIVTAGAWINHVLDSCGVHIPIYVTQEQVTYLATPNMKHFTKERIPLWCYHSNHHDFYGLPIHGNTGVKVGIDAGGPVVSTLTRTFIPDPVREQSCIELLQRILPKSVGPVLYTKTCLYTMPADRDFIIDTCHRTGWKDVIVCNGAGHAYKFAGLLGKILSEMAIDGKTKYDIESFSLNRDAINDPNYTPSFIMGAEKCSVNKENTKKSKAKL